MDFVIVAGDPYPESIAASQKYQDAPAHAPPAPLAQGQPCLEVSSSGCGEIISSDMPLPTGGTLGKRTVSSSRL